MYYSTDGINWIGITTNNDNYTQIISLCYGDGKYIALCGYDKISNPSISTNIYQYSTDGINWISGTIDKTSRKYNKVCYGNGVFLVIAFDTNTIAYTKSSSLNWTVDTSFTSFKITTCEYDLNEDQFWIIGYQSDSSYSNGVGQTKYKYVSTEKLLTGTGTSASGSVGPESYSNSKIFYCSCWGNNEIAFIGCNYDNGKETCAFFRPSDSSVNGFTTYEGGYIGGSSNNIYHRIAYGNNKYVAIPFPGTSFAYCDGSPYPSTLDYIS